jgi:hypothetical protein
MEMVPVRILAVDPGGNTGFAEWRDGAWRAWAEPWEDACATVHRELATDVDHCVFESFHISAQTAKKSTAGSLQAIELIDIGRYMARVYDVPFSTQSPSEAKMFATDAKLRALGWWTKGVDHPRDATRHLVLHLCTNRIIDLTALRRALDAGTKIR